MGAAGAVDAEQQRLWREADAVLDRLLDLPDAARAAQLAALPGPLRARVERLLAADAGAGPLDRTLPLPAADDDDEPGRAPRSIGPWTLGAALGRGGMAIVYEASRPIAGGEQQAALKLLTVAALAADGRRRFECEHRALARLAHPHIAALLDGGVLDDGTPYLAMQRVHGERIDAYCRGRGLEPAAIVRLFLQVCDAVAYAHRQLVLHRDLKPANVMVDGDGHVRLLDFGIARLVDAVDSEDTRTAFRALTPQYAAPEQFTGTDTGTAVDVFGLGALLYQLLTGRAPRQAVQDATPTRPSRAAANAEGFSPAQRLAFSRALRGDLDAILAKALEHDPARRYPDAVALGEDLRRWLEQRPVLAARGNRGYRLRKFVARHRQAVAAAVVIGVVGTVGLAGTVWQAQLARAEAARANAVKDFVLEIFRASAPERARGEDPPASELLRRGAERVRSELVGRPRLLAEMLQVIGGVQLERGLIEDARDSLDAALAQPLPAADARLRIHAAVDRAIVDYELGRSSAAVERLQAVHAEALARLAPDDPLLVLVEVQLADQLIMVDRIADAIALAGSARKRIERHGDPTRDPEYPHALRVLGAAHHLAVDWNTGVPLLRAALDAQRAIDAEGTMYPAIANDLGLALLDAGDIDGAEAALVEALQRQRVLFGDHHPVTRTTVTNVATLHLSHGRFAEAVDAFEGLVAAMPAADDGLPPHPDDAHTLGMAALARYRHGEFVAAEHRAEAAIGMMERLEEADVARVRWIRAVLGALRLERGDHGAAPLFAASGIDCELRGTGSFLTLRTCVGLAWLARREHAGCSLPAADPPDEPAAFDRLWWTMYWQLRAACDDDADDRSRAGARAAGLLALLEPAPDWLQLAR
jgi:eukaryotic-like serine/threonine-protein kinase